MNDLLPPILVIIALAAGAMMLGDHHEASQRAIYCEMISIWDADAARGLPPSERDGWPPYRGREVCR